ncbi:hypothetical protein AEAC466_11295 [Asticcacaulis sp. AC466]|uniref:autotransporter domain-containing protein n=1 Tax=Asticcacaulis sp. AC466 TaxID=1282362 RepID=UPI0003C3D1D0|nr:autotransporter domain-containing protein [Asticcacaulis sp. AC466]ESQ83906.1 hypothetical protein AEAC466_11295 [Asticcacaulis sp. AC466]
MKKTLTLALLASMVSAAPFAAHAQSYTRLVSFGDSLSDNGNLYTATGNPPPPYNKRFTNDLVWNEYLAGSGQGFFTPPATINTGNVYYGWGGARSDSAANSSGPIPGTPTQIGAFLSRGGTFGANDVVAMWAGANDIFQALPTAAANPATASTYMTGIAATAAGNVATQVGQLSTAGAKTIVVMNLPDLGSTPNFNVDPSTSALTSLTSGVFNTALDAGLKTQAASHTGTNIIEVDIKSAFTAIVANPSAFGFSNVTQACINVTACVTGSQDTRNTYLFWDGVHPTAGGHRVVAALTAQYIYTPTLTQGVGMLADGSYNMRRSVQSEMSGLFHANGSKGGYFLQVVGSQAERHMNVAMQSTIGGATSTSDQSAYDYSLGGIRAGAVQPVNDRLSFAIGVTAMTGDAKAMMVQAKPTDLSVDVGLDWRPGAYFVTGTLGAGITSYSNYERHTLIDGFRETANHVDTTAYSASVQTGFDKDMGGWTVTPVARLSYAAAKMGSFNEQGVVAAVAFEDRQVSAFSGAVELQASGQLSANTRLSGVIGYEGVFSGDAGDLRGQLIGNTAQAYMVSMGDVGSPGALVGVGVETRFSGFSLKAQYRGTFGSDNQKDQTALISLNKAF